MKTIPINRVFSEINDEKHDTELAFFFVLIKRSLKKDILLSEDEADGFKKKIDIMIKEDTIRDSIVPEIVAELESQQQSL